VSWRQFMYGAAVLLSLAAGRTAPLPNVVAVAPSGSTIPERLLRLSLTFATPPLDAVLPQIALLHQDGSVIQGALLDQELWSPDRRTLTLLLDPGRVKTGLIKHDTQGLALRSGDRVTLQVADQLARQWTVIPGGCVVPDPKTWQVKVPSAGTALPLTLVFPVAIDAQSRDLIAVANEKGDRIQGASQLLNGETVWRFTPVVPWSRGQLRLLVHPRLESPCGDEIGEAFEHATGNGLGSQRATLGRWFSIN